MSHTLKFAIAAAAVFSTTSVALAFDPAREEQWQDGANYRRPYVMSMAAANAQASAVMPREFRADAVNGFRGVVVSGAQVIGRDPDANIRTQIQREYASKAGE